MPSATLRKIVKSGRRFDLTWRYGFNLKPTLSYLFTPQRLSAETKRVVHDLDQNGIAITSVTELLEEDSVFRELSWAVEELQAKKTSILNEKSQKAIYSEAIGEKTFNLELLGSRPELDLQSVYARFALQPRILQVANGYFRMYTRLRYYNVWHTFASHAKARESQLWHRDREDRFILKMFVYLSDVSDGAGPLTYAAGSHLKGDFCDEPKYFLEGDVKRSTDEQMAAVIPAERWVRATGKRTTIVFADTRGYHKGGLARKRDRLMYLAMFTSQASESKNLLDVGRPFQLPLDKAGSFALSYLSSSKSKTKGQTFDSGHKRY